MDIIEQRSKPYEFLIIEVEVMALEIHHHRSILLAMIFAILLVTNYCYTNLPPAFIKAIHVTSYLPHLILYLYSISLPQFPDFKI